MTESLIDRFKRNTDVTSSAEEIADRLAEYGEMIFVGLGEAEDPNLVEFMDICMWAIKWYVGDPTLDD